jgi:hypothetical protein
MRLHGALYRAFDLMISYVVLLLAPRQRIEWTKEWPAGRRSNTGPGSGARIAPHFGLHRLALSKFVAARNFGTDASWICFWSVGRLF